MKNIDMSVRAVGRLIVLFVLIINSLLTAAGKNPIPFDETAFTACIAYVATGLQTIWVWWKDSPMTKGARERKGKQLIEEGQQQSNIVVEDMEGEYDESNA